MQEEMIKRAIPLVLVESLTGLWGKTRMQKLIFLIQKETETRGKVIFSFKYEPYLYGPFSSEVCFVIDSLISDGYLSVSINPTSSGNIVNVYQLTSEGKDYLQKLRRDHVISKDLEQIIQKIFYEYGQLPLSDLVNEAYKQI